VCRCICGDRLGSFQKDPDPNPSHHQACVKWTAENSILHRSMTLDMQVPFDHDLNI